MKKIIILLIFYFSVAFGQITINSDITPTKGYIGNIFKYEIEVIFSSKYKVEIPKFSDEKIGNFEILSKDISTKRDDKENFVNKLSFEIVTFDTGWQEISPVQIGFQDTVNKSKAEYKYSDAKNVFIFSAMDSVKNVVDVKPPFSLRIFSVWDWIIIVILLSVLAGLIWYGIIKKRKKIIKKEPKYELTPMETTIKELEILKSKDYLENKLWKEFYIELTFIIKKFYEEYYFIHLKESTTEEILPTMKEAIPKKEYEFFKKLFTSSDFVKFAKQESNLKRCEDDFDRVKEIIISYK
ncbi:MAG: hypothetical protein U9R41_01560 [Candidatus Marinimicrobia bacterium]|nr:hypothetical protein [Candidatus Neomarinimicrobiota bacterium]